MLLPIFLRSVFFWNWRLALVRWLYRASSVRRLAERCALAFLDGDIWASVREVVYQSIRSSFRELYRGQLLLSNVRCRNITFSPHFLHVCWYLLL